MSVDAAPDRLHRLRRVAIIVIIVSLSVTALIGIITLLSASFGELQVRVMLSTLVIGAFSIIALCDLAIVGLRFRWSGLIGLALAVVALILTLVLIWWVSGAAPPEGLWKTTAILGLLAVSFAHANLLLQLGDRQRSVVRVGLWVTLGLIALLAILVIVLIVNQDVGSDGYARLLGTVAILDVLGTIVVPVLGAFLRDGASGTRRLVLDVPAELDARLAAAGPTREAAALAALEKLL